MRRLVKEGAWAFGRLVGAFIGVLGTSAEVAQTAGRVRLPPPPTAGTPPLRPPSPRNVPAEAADPDFQQLMSQSQRSLMNLQGMTTDAHVAAFGAILAAICSAASRLMAKIVTASTQRLTHANSLEMTLDSAAHVVGSYIEMESGSLIVEASRKASIESQFAEEFLPTMLAALADFERRLDEPDVLDLESRVKATLLRLRMEGL